MAGTVELDGKPVHSGNIVFVPTKGSAVSAPIKDGAYTVEDVPTGEVTVTVENLEAKQLVEQSKPGSGGGRPAFMKGGNDPKDFGTKGAGKGFEMSPEARAGLEKQAQAAQEGQQRNKDQIDNYRPIPEQYNDPKTSGLKYTIKSGTNTINVTLSSK